MAKKKKYRVNPKPSGVPSGRPHRNADFVNASRSFMRDYDRVRAGRDSEKEVLASELFSEARSKLKNVEDIEEKKYQIAEYSKTVDFAPYYESISNMRYDLEGFLGAIRGTFGEDKYADEMYSRYELVLRKCKALVSSLKALEKPLKESDEDDDED